MNKSIQLLFLIALVGVMVIQTESKPGEDTKAHLDKVILHKL